MATQEEMLGPEVHCWLVESFLLASVDGTWKRVWTVETRLYLVGLVIEHLSQKEETLWPGRMQNIREKQHLKWYSL